MMVSANEFLDKMYKKLLDNTILDCMEELIYGLNNIKNEMGSSEWETFSKVECLKHPIKNLVHQDPLTLRAFDKPRGYPGDAVILDFIYYPHKLDFSKVSEIGRKVFSYTSQGGSSRSVRRRKEIIATYINETVFKKKNCRILSLACAHLREIEDSTAFNNDEIKEFFALDQDNETLKVIENYKKTFIKPMNVSVRNILKNEVIFDNLDFVYSAGLYDYLETSIAQALTKKLFSMLNSGGKLLIANFLPKIKDSGYVESFMGWYLIGRTEEEFISMTDLISSTEINEIKTFNDEDNNVVYLELNKI